MEKTKITRNSATARNSNDINIKVMVGDAPKKKRVRRKPRVVAPQPPVVQNVVQLPPTEVAVPNVTFGRPQYNFVTPRPYDDPDGQGMGVVGFPELIQNYQSRQEVMGMPTQPQVAMTEAPAEAPAPAEVAPAVEPVAPLPEERPLSPEEIQQIAEEAGRRSVKAEAMSKLDKVIGFIYNESDLGMIRELTASMFPEGTSAKDVWQQVGRMVQRMPPSAERDAVMRLIIGETPSTSMAPSSAPRVDTPVRKAPRKESIEESLISKKERDLLEQLDAIPVDAKGNIKHGYKGIQKKLMKELRELRKK